MYGDSHWRGCDNLLSHIKLGTVLKCGELARVTNTNVRRRRGGKDGSSIGIWLWRTERSTCNGKGGGEIALMRVDLLLLLQVTIKYVNQVLRFIYYSFTITRVENG